MNVTENIKSFKRVVPMIYAYTTPGIPYHDGWTKIGYTEKQTVEDRIKQQTHTAGIRWNLEWADNAIYKDSSGEYFDDHDFHNYLMVQKQVKREENTEWFNIDGTLSYKYFNSFCRRELPKSDVQCEYNLRKEQRKAVEITKEYFEDGGTEFLWNAKPRFGKTLTAYDLIQQMNLSNVLIVTNRPSIAHSWADDFNKFIGWKGNYCFVSETSSLKDVPNVLSKDDFNSYMIDNKKDYGMIAFESLQGLKGSIYFGGNIDKLKWMSQLNFDLLIVDESHEGVDTLLTEKAFEQIKRKYTLYLSGTPFKAIANEKFGYNQIYNWSYADEQEAKNNWDSTKDYNPYEAMPKLSMYTYQLSNMIYDEINKGYDLSDDENIDYAFDLNEFFKTKTNGKFLHEDEIKKFLRALSTQDKYPFSTPELRKELSHTLWLLNRVDSAKALFKLLQEDEVFKEYKIVLAAGDGKLDDDNKIEESLERVKRAIQEYDKTITLSVGQLTVGVTIPEWSGVLMLCNMKSPSSYMQAAFRTQNPCIKTINGERYRKENAYVFDFDPTRTLVIFDEFANNLSLYRGTSDERKENIKRLLNFFPVIAEDTEGTMVELDATQVLSIPRRLKSQEVVKRGFMSNFLFKNISNVFGASNVVKDIIEKMTPSQDFSPKFRNMDDINTDEDGNVEVPKEITIGTAHDVFGDKYYEDIEPDLNNSITSIIEENPMVDDEQIEAIADAVKETMSKKIVDPIADNYDLTKKHKDKINKDMHREIDKKFEKYKFDLSRETKIAELDLKKQRETATTEEEITKAENDYHTNIQEALNKFTAEVQDYTKKTIEEKPKEVIETIEKDKLEKEKKSVEDSVRDHLRGFTRTIPSFIMAYGDDNLRLSNFDEYTEDDVFLEVTGITEDEFRFLRDGGDYTDEETGETRTFKGQLFDEVVFNDSIHEFLNKRDELSNYFDESLEEDIFDYIPPQKTNQIFTPKWVVKKMVDELEENNPGCFDNPDATFADLYMKSGLYITEIVKRLFKSEKMKEMYPDDNMRIKHIINHQVYGMAPTRIIYLISTNYILGFDDTLKAEATHFVQADAAEASKNDSLQELVDKYFG